MAFGCYAIWYVLHMFLGNSVSTMLAIFAGAVIYMISLVAFRGLGREELQKLPKGDLIAGIFTKMGLLH